MDQNLDSTARLSHEEMKFLMARRDGPGLLRFVVQSTVFVVFEALTIHLATTLPPTSWLPYATSFVAALALLTFFASMHEAGHGTAFATPWINRAVTAISAFLMLQAPTFFREFHFEHHRRTSDPLGDPEINGAPGILGPWPSNPLLYVAQASGQHLMIGKAMFTISCALLPGQVLFDRLYPFIRPSLRRRVAWESRAVAILWIGIAGYGLRHVPAFGMLLLAWPIAHVALSLFVMPEHTGLDTSGTQLHRTRSIRSNALVRWAMWNMPYHAEHHGFPAVPFHAAARLSARIEPDLENRVSGYLTFHAEGLRRAFGLQRGA